MAARYLNGFLMMFSFLLWSERRGLGRDPGARRRCVYNASLVPLWGLVLRGKMFYKCMKNNGFFLRVLEGSGADGWCVMALRHSGRYTLCHGG